MQYSHSFKYDFFQAINMILLHIFTSVYTTFFENEHSFSVLSLFINGFLFYSIAKKDNATGNYRYLLLTFSVQDILYSISHHLTYPVSLVSLFSNESYILGSRKLCEFVSFPWERFSFLNKSFPASLWYLITVDNGKFLLSTTIAQRVCSKGE